jgi:ribose transport system permease protein
VIGGAAMFVLHRTTLGRAIYAVGNREQAAFLSGIDTRRVTLLCFVMAGACSAIAGVLLTGYSTKAYQAMGDAYLLPAIAAVVLGGTNILGGSGSYLGTVVGVILITLLQSILSVMQIPEMGRQIIYGVVIIVMLLIYGRGRRHSD